MGEERGRALRRVSLLRGAPRACADLLGQRGVAPHLALDLDTCAVLFDAPGHRVDLVAGDQVALAVEGVTRITEMKPSELNCCRVQSHATAMPNENSVSRNQLQSFGLGADLPC